jgi:transposase
MKQEKQWIKALTAQEQETLEELVAHHRLVRYCLRARGVLSLNAGHKPILIGEVLGVSLQTVHNWRHRWEEYGLVGLFDGQKDGRPAKLTASMLDTAEELARSEPLTLGMIRERLLAHHQDAEQFSLDRLSIGLRKRGLSFKRTRLSLKKTL